MKGQQQSGNLLIACYSDGKDIPSLFQFDAVKKTAASVLTEINPSYVVRSDGHYYVAGEHQAGLLITLNQKYEVISRIHSLGDDPCQITLDNTGKFIVVTNYSSASVLICKLENHIPTSVHSFITHEGSSLNPDRQSSPHPHCSVFSEQNDKLFVTDLGTDWIYYYDFTPQKVVWSKQKSIKIEGAGPRTICRGRPRSNLLYLTCELDNTLRVLNCKDGLQQVVAYKISQNELNYPAEVKYLNQKIYVSLRGDNKIMIFNQRQDKLQQNCSFKVGDWPRYFSITPSGYLYVACQKGNVVQKYHITEQKIVLQAEIKLNTPSCIQVL